MIFVTTNDILKLIEQSTNTDDDKALFSQIVQTSDVCEAISKKMGLLLITVEGESFILKDVTMKDLIFKNNKAVEVLQKKNNVPIVKKLICYLRQLSLILLLLN